MMGAALPLAYCCTPFHGGWRSGQSLKKLGRTVKHPRHVPQSVFLYGKHRHHLATWRLSIHCILVPIIWLWSSGVRGDAWIYNSGSYVYKKREGGNTSGCTVHKLSLTSVLLISALPASLRSLYYLILIFALCALLDPDLSFLLTSALSALLYSDLCSLCFMLS